MWSACLLLLCLVAGSRQLSITEFVVPAAVEEGEDAHLRCRYDLSEDESEIAEKTLFVKWWWTPLNGSNDQRSQLYQRIAGYNSVAIHDNIAIYEKDGIILLNATTADSGIYECEVSNIDEVRQHQKLIVFSKGSGPLLNVSTAEDGPDEDQDVVVTCEAFDVAPRPDIVISLNGQIVNSSGYVVETTDGQYDIYENATVSMDEADDGEFRCEIFYKDDNITHAPFVASQTFNAPAVSTTEASVVTAATDTSSDTSQPSDSASENFGTSWISLPLAILTIIYINVIT